MSRWAMLPCECEQHQLVLKFEQFPQLSLDSVEGCFLFVDAAFHVVDRVLESSEEGVETPG